MKIKAIIIMHHLKYINQILIMFLKMMNQMILYQIRIIYIGCEDGNVKLIQLNNKSTVKNLIGYY